MEGAILGLDLSVMLHLMLPPEAVPTPYHRPLSPSLLRSTDGNLEAEALVRAWIVLWHCVELINAQRAA